MRLDQFAIRRGSGGQGAHRGGDGVIRAVTFLEPMRANILANRRRVPPRGIDGRCGCAGRPQLGRANRRQRRNAERDRFRRDAAGRPLRDRDSRRRRVREGRRMIDYWPLLGIALVVVGFALRFNPLLVVAVSAIVTGLLGGMPFLKVLAALGHGFNENRNVTIIYIVLPVIGLLERYGLQQRARALIAEMRGATDGPVVDRLSLLPASPRGAGLTSVTGHAQTVRPLVAPMAIAAAEKEHGELDEETAERVKAMSAATDNVGLFFGEDIFLAIASILLIQGALRVSASS